MPVLYTLLAIVLFFVIVFSIHLSLIISCDEKTVVSVKWLFLNITLFDSEKPKKPKKKKEKKKKPEKEKPPEEEKKPAEKKKGNGLLKQLYIDQGYDGIEKMFRALGNALGRFSTKLYRTFIIDEFYLTMKTAGNDAAATAIKYGKLTAWLFPVLGKVASTCKVKKYDVDVSPDYLAKKSKASLYTRIHFTPIHITNAAVVLAVQLVFKVLFKVLFAKKKSDKSREINSSNDKAEGDKTTAESGEEAAKTEETANNSIQQNKGGASS